MNIMTPDQEHRLRNRRLAELGMPQEKKRGLPGDFHSGGGGAVVTEWVMADRVLHFLSDGPQTKNALRTGCSASKSLMEILCKLERDGKVRSYVIGRATYYEVAK